MSPRALAAPMHLHTREDEYSFVLQGRMGALLGDDVVEAGPGDLVFKPRNQWHTFWNAGDVPCRILEIISPAGFENSSGSFRTWAVRSRRNRSEVAALGDRYGLVMRPETVPSWPSASGSRSASRSPAAGRCNAIEAWGSLGSPRSPTMVRRGAQDHAGGRRRTADRYGHESAQAVERRLYPGGGRRRRPLHRHGSPLQRGESEATIGEAGVAGECVVATKGGYQPGRGPARRPAGADRREPPPAADGHHPALLPAQGRTRTRRSRRASPRSPSTATRARSGTSAISNVASSRWSARAGRPGGRRPEPLQPGEREHEDVVDYCTAEGIVFVPYFPLRGVDGGGWPRSRSEHGATARADSARLAAAAARR